MTALTCPDCKVDLSAVTSGSVIAHRCGRCRGIWLDPAAFQLVCEEEAGPPDGETAIVHSRAAPFRGGAPHRDERVRYRACPRCAEVMSRSNFARVSGVVLDVCRPHGAWFDRGELSAIRRFLGGGGLRRYERSRQMERERRPSTAARPEPRNASLDDIYDILADSDTSWDVPSRIPWLLVAAFFGATGGLLVWLAFHPGRYFGRSLGSGPALLGVISLYFASRALARWAAQRGR